MVKAFNGVTNIWYTPMKRSQKLFILAGDNFYQLPQYDRISNGNVLEAFESIDDWTYYAGTFAANTTEYRTGTQSIKVTTREGASGYGDKRVLSPSINFGGSAPNRFRISFYLAEDYENLSGITISLADELHFNTYFYTEIFFTGTNAYGCRKGWNTIDVYSDQWVTSGVISWESDITSVRVAVFPIAGQIINVSFDEIRYAVTMKPGVIITFDGVQASHYNSAFPIMRAKKARGTIFVRQSDVAETTPTWANYLEMYNFGWDIGLYPSITGTLVDLTSGELDTMFATDLAVLDGEGFTRSSKYMSYPGGAYNETVFVAMATAEIKLARTSVSQKFMTDISDGNYILAEYIHLDASLTDVATIKTVIDTVLSSGRLVCFNIHSLVESGAGLGSFLVSDFQEIINYIVSKDIPFLTMNDYYNMQSSAIKIKR